MSKPAPFDRIIARPQELKALTGGQLKALADELRKRIIAAVSNCGGHLASNLGVADLTVALHFVFDFPRDRLLWDVGHQCYCHKILTGRSKDFERRLRQAGGVSGFPSPAESEHDLFYTGHAGSAISTAAGLAWADFAADRGTKIVAVVGDASIANGLAMEGLNNAALLQRQFLIVLNDNSMAIDRTHGALARALDRIRLTQTYTGLKHATESFLERLPRGHNIRHALHQIKEGLKTTIHGGQIFEALGVQYYGPIDGHNMGELVRMLRRVSTINRPVLLHVHTQKGRGCRYAVEDPCRFHSPSAYKVEGGEAVFAERTRPTWTDVFAETLIHLARRDKRVVAITAAMPDGTGLAKFREALPGRYIDVGISESHAVAMAAGLSKAGLRPVVAVYSTFCQRAMDQVFQECALQRLPVVLCLDRAGLVGADGAVHHGFMDIAYLRPLPGMVLTAPADGLELRAALRLALTLDTPVAIRYPRDEVCADLPGPCPPFALGRARVVREGRDAALLCYGTMVERALHAADLLQSEGGPHAAVVSARFAKPLDEELIVRLIRSGRPVVACEEHVLAGGFGAAVLELAARRGLNTANVRLMGLPDAFISHAPRREQLTEAGLDATHIAAKVKEMAVRQIGTAAR